MSDFSFYNANFLAKLDTAEGKSKHSQHGGEYIRDHLREERFVSKILTPKPVTPEECKPSVHQDTLTIIEQLEPESRAMVLPFRGQPDARLIRAPRVEIPFLTVSSERFEAYEEELQAYRMKITKVVEENAAKDVQEVEDLEFLVHCEAAVQALQQEANGGVVTSLHETTITAGTVVESSARKGILARVDTNNDARVWPFQRDDVVRLHQLLDGNKLRCTKLLLTEYDFDSINTWTVEDYGSKLESETAIDGFTYEKLVGRGYVRTIKTDILRPGNVYGFTDEEFLGRFYVLNATKFFIDKHFNEITWQCWETIAMSIINVASVRKMELYSGDATTLNNDGIRASVIPVDEEDLGAMNNRVEDEVYFPRVYFY
jgi:hypothetical protein